MFIFETPMLLAVDKPTGITSYDVIRALKKVYGREKIGHSGTLDPMASGLLLIGVGKGTKMLNTLQGLDKSYTTTIDFSKQSDTRDMEYWEEFEEMPLHRVNAPEVADIENFLQKLIPEYLLPLTPFSAKKKNGKKLYELARAGEKIVQDRLMITHSYEIISYDFPELILQLTVGSGTYIRSIGYWLGKQLAQKTEQNLGGILTELRRNSIGTYVLSEIKLEKKVSRFDKKNEKEYTITYQEILP